mmetsp:Transcript_143782/g.460252  ORF Transcript_143782/g.460252 Transcript_143782/m.460252 type:complete len:224 (+) Transcript_143782:883-1554(+)
MQVRPPLLACRNCSLCRARSADIGIALGCKVQTRNHSRDRSVSGCLGSLPDWARQGVEQASEFAGHLAGVVCNTERLGQRSVRQGSRNRSFMGEVGGSCPALASRTGVGIRCRHLHAWGGCIGAGVPRGVDSQPSVDLVANAGEYAEQLALGHFALRGECRFQRFGCRDAEQLREIYRSLGPIGSLASRGGYVLETDLGSIGCKQLVVAPPGSRGVVCTFCRQ